MWTLRRQGLRGSAKSAAARSTGRGFGAAGAEGGGRMHLWELSESYEAAARPLRARLAELRKLLAQEKDPEEIWHLKRRIAELTPMLTEMNELAELTRRYYEPGYHRNEKYTL